MFFSNFPHFLLRLKSGHIKCSLKRERERGEKKREEKRKGKEKKSKVLALWVKGLNYHLPSQHPIGAPVACSTSRSASCWCVWGKQCKMGLARGPLPTHAEGSRVLGSWLHSPGTTLQQLWAVNLQMEDSLPFSPWLCFSNKTDHLKIKIYMYYKLQSCNKGSDTYKTT